MNAAKQLTLCWVKRDARLAENACLAAAHNRGLELLLLFYFEPLKRAARDSLPMHVLAQWGAVTALRGSLQERRADFVIAHGGSGRETREIECPFPFTHLFNHKQIGNELTFRRVRTVAAWCRDRGVEYREFNQSSVRRGGVNRDRLYRLWQSRIIDQPPLPVPPIRQSLECQ